MFDLEKAIADWRREVASSWTGDVATLDELEDHLREQFAAMLCAGHAEGEAWRMASDQLGDHAAIRREFAKINRLPALDRCALTGLTIAAGITCVAFPVLFFGNARGAVLADTLLSTHIIAITLGYAIGIFAAMLAGYVTLRRYFAERWAGSLFGAVQRPLQVACIAAATLTVLGFSLGAIWANREWGHAFTWDSKEFGAIVVAMTFIAGAVATRRDSHSTGIALAIATVGGGAVLAAWFGTAGNPLLLTLIGFGGLAMTLAVAAVALRSRDAEIQSVDNET
jgi:hypothetical protein